MTAGADGADIAGRRRAVRMSLDIQHARIPPRRTMAHDTDGVSARTPATAASVKGRDRTPVVTGRDRRITGVVLAGGLGRRMGGVEKALVAFRGRPLIAHVIERLLPQVTELLVNANRQTQRYETFGLPVVVDAIDGLVGPLAGLYTGLVRGANDLVLTVPCDSPWLPPDLAQRLLARMESEDAELAVARVGGRLHPVFCLSRRGLAPELAAYLEGGGRGVQQWMMSRRVAIEDFDDRPAAFENINTEDDLRRLEAAAGAAPDVG